MAKLSKVAAKLHQQALDLVHSDKHLSLEDRYFILEHFQEAATNMNGLAGAFFTPEGLANDLSIEVQQCGSLIDLCAGIGRLAFACRERARRIVCVELNPDYALVGKRVLPEAEWIIGSVFDQDQLGRFDVAISNPPFGAVRTAGTFKRHYTGANFEYKLIEFASTVADHGAFIIPQASAPFRYSGCRSYGVELSRECEKFMTQSGVLLEHNCGLDTTAYLQDWHGVSPTCEIVLTDFTDPLAAAEKIRALIAAQGAESTSVQRQPRASTVASGRQPGPCTPPVAAVPTPPTPTHSPRRSTKAKPPASHPQLSLFDAA